MSYQEPEWAIKPSSSGEWYLTEIKNGVEIEKHNLDCRPTTVFGRATDMVHVPLNHESASRQHARIAFDSQGIPWLRDLKSTHGTVVNKKHLPESTRGKLESNSQKAGSRGIVLYPGDILQFGASTRIFCLEGPPEFDRGAMKAKLQQQQQQQTTKATGQINHVAQPTQQTINPNANKKQNNDDSVSWGISMDDDVDEETTASTADKTLPMDMQVPDKYRKAFDKLNTMKYKLSNLETEDGRIRRKGELSQGQEKQLQRNAERETNLKRSIVEFEEQLYDKIYPEKAGSKKRESSSRRNISDEEGDDDFFDRTKKGEENFIEAEESEKSLCAKWEKLFEQKKHHEAKINRAQRNVDTLRQKLSRLQANGDEDAFFVSNDLALANEALEKILDEQQRAINNMEEIEKLLKIVNPKIQTDRNSGYIGESIQKVEPKIERAEMLPPPIRLPAVPKKIEADSNTDQFSMPPPVMREPIKPSNAKNDNLMPPPKRKRVVGPAMPPPSAPQVGQPSGKGTLAFLSSMTKPENTSSPEKPSTRNVKKSAIDSKKDEWRAPEGQDGSGITKLNEKFAGRY